MSRATKATCVSAGFIVARRPSSELRRHCGQDQLGERLAKVRALGAGRRRMPTAAERRRESREIDRTIGRATEAEREALRVVEREDGVRRGLAPCVADLAR